MFNSDLIVNGITYFVVLVEHVGRPLHPPPPHTHTHLHTDRQTDRETNTDIHSAPTYTYVDSDTLSGCAADI